MATTSDDGAAGLTFSVASAFLNSASARRGPFGNRVRYSFSAASASSHRDSDRSPSIRTSAASAWGTLPAGTLAAHSSAPAQSPRRSRQRAAL